MSNYSALCVALSSFENDAISIALSFVTISLANARHLITAHLNVKSFLKREAITEQRDELAVTVCVALSSF